MNSHDSLKRSNDSKSTTAKKKQKKLSEQKNDPSPTKKVPTSSKSKKKKSMQYKSKVQNKPTPAKLTVTKDMLLKPAHLEPESQKQLISDSNLEEKKIKTSTQFRRKPIVKSATSSSDSEDTDMEEVKKPTQTRVIIQKKKAIKQASSDSDSDDTDIKKAKNPTQTRAVAQKKQLAKQFSSDSDSDDTDMEEVKRPKQSRVAVEKKQVAKQFSSDSDSDDTDMEEVKKPSKPQKMPTQSRATTQKKLVTKQASSDSDSDSTDMEEVKKLPKPTQARAATQKKPITRQASSESDSDSTDVEKEKKLPESQKRPTKSRPTTSKKHASQQTSSESDDSDREAVKKQFLSKKFISESDSDSDDTDKEKNQKKTTTQTAKGKDDKAESDSDSNSDEDGTFVYRKQKRLNLERNRISNRKTCAYDENRSAAWNYKNKASDAFVPTVYEDFFISDSESDTDSGDDYNSDSFPVWQQSLRGKKEGETNWPKRKKFGYSDNLKLEKRVKKICRRENISFQEVQEIFASERPTTHKKFYQKIARVFPNVPIKSIVAHCRDSYHPNRNNKEWTKEDVSRLNQLVEFHGRNARLIAKDMNRMTSDVQTYMSKHLKDDKKKNNKSRWTKEEDEVLAKGITELKAKNGESFQIASLERLFNGEKSRFQLQNRYKRIKHLIQPDGSLLSNRKANVLEELEFLERLKEQVVEEKLVEESQLNFSKYCGFAKPTFYYQRRATIPGFEKMKVIDILNTLIKKQKIIVDSRRSEGLL